MEAKILIMALFGFVLNGVAQNKDNQNVTVDFFYGTWTDSTKTGMTLTRENEVFWYPKHQKNGLEDLAQNEMAWVYHLFLDRRPIVIEITCMQCDDKPGPALLRGNIEVVNSRQIYFTPLNKNGELKQTVLMSKE